MDYFVFSRISGYYLLLDDAEDTDAITARSNRFFSSESVKPILQSKTCSGEDLYNVFGGKINFLRSRYSVGNGDNYLLLLPVGSPMFKRRQFEAAVVEAKHRVTEFELATKERLINALYATDTSLGEYVNAWAEYFFFDHYALWIYNRFARAFTCSTSSFEHPRNIIFEHEDSPLNVVLDDDYQTEYRAPHADRLTRDETRDIKTIHRMKLTLGYDGTIGVLTLYSRHADFHLQPKNHLEIRNSIETKYLQVRQQANQAMYQINQQFIET